MNLPISDWDTAYNNSAAVTDSASFAERWQQQASDFRQALSRTGQLQTELAYGQAPREQYDLFTPTVAPLGLVIFIHGGYWMRFDKNTWSHLANGPLLKGWQVAIPSYTLCPETTIAEITKQIAEAVCHLADQHPGPIRLAGHSAGGHLVSRMMCESSGLPDSVSEQIEKTVSISGVHDLRPLCKTSMNDTLKLDDDMAGKESPVLLTPRENSNITCWVGGQELPEFIRQSKLLSTMWYGLGATTDAFAEPGKHHFSVVEGLARHDSPLVAKLLGE